MQRIRLLLPNKSVGLKSGVVKTLTVLLTIQCWVLYRVQCHYTPVLGIVQDVEMPALDWGKHSKSFNYSISSGAFNMSLMKMNISPRPSPHPHFLPSNNRTTSNRPLSAANYPAFRRTVTTTPHNPATATSARHAGSSTRMPSYHVRTPSTRYTVPTLATRPMLST